MNTSSSASSGNIISSWIHNITGGIEDDINEDLSSLAKDLGLHDWYSAHILDYCEGYYTPAAVANATLSKHDIHKNITSCSNRTAFFTFNPTNVLQHELNQSGVGVNLTSLDWPDGINDAIKTLRVAQKAAFILYCIAAGTLLIAALSALAGVFFSGRLSASINILICCLAFLAILIASAISTAVAVKAAHAINKHGKIVGVSASKGGRFMALTWVATGLAFLNILVWMFECVVGRRQRRSSKTNADFVASQR